MISSTNWEVRHPMMPELPAALTADPTPCGRQHQKLKYIPTIRLLVHGTLHLGRGHTVDIHGRRAYYYWSNLEESNDQWTVVVRKFHGIAKVGRNAREDTDRFLF